MYRKQFEEELAYEAGLSSAKATEVIDLFLAKIVKCLIRGEEVRFNEFGTFKTKMQSRENFLDPTSGKPLKREPKLVPRLDFSKKVKDKVRGESQ